MPRPAVVKFIGDENEYRLGHDCCECRYCRDCETKSKCDKPPIFQFTKRKNYHAFFVEYWQGVRDSLHVKGNDGMIDDFNPLADFEIISDPDNVLNNYEASVRCISHDFDDNDFLRLTYGKTYKAIGREHDGLYLVMDDSYDCYFYSPKLFEIVDDPHGILNRESVYYSFQNGRRDPPGVEDYIAAHTYSSNHRAELEKDRVCGCFYCLKIFDPKEIEEWLGHENGDPLGTAICPYCGIDSVIGESSQYPITEQFLRKMRDYWF